MLYLLSKSYTVIDITVYSLLYVLIQDLNYKPYLNYKLFISQKQCDT